MIKNLKDLIIEIGKLIDVLLPVVGGLALLAFFWGLIKFIWHAGDPKKVGEGKNIMFWGIAALFVMFSIWGIINFFGNTLGIGGGIVQIKQI